MSMFMAAMAQELHENGRIEGMGGLSSAAWANEVRDYQAKLADLTPHVPQEPAEAAHRPANWR